MEQIFHAIYEDGVLRLDSPLSLPEHARVVGQVTTVEATAKPSSLSADEIDKLLDEAAVDGPPYQGTYPRADIYLDHD
jgi:predicted DNA-binding antitoxin AbrB/MazE fold protein